MTRELVNHVTAEEAAFVRTWATINAAGVGAVAATSPPPSDRIWQPREGQVEVIERRDRRARCRECGHTIEPGQQAVRFGFTTHPSGKVGTAFIHAWACPAEEEDNVPEKRWQDAATQTEANEMAWHTSFYAVRDKDNRTGAFVWWPEDGRLTFADRAEPWHLWSPLKTIEEKVTLDEARARAHAEGFTYEESA